MALGSTHPLTEMRTRSLPGGKCGRCVGLTTLSPSSAVVKKSGNLNFVEPSGPLQACKGTALHFLCVYILNQAPVTEDRLARLYKRPVSTYIDLCNEISPAWRCIKRPRTSVGDGYRAPDRHRLEYRVLARAVVSPGNVFNCRLYLFR
jgi:hypothetical protein